MSVFSQSQAFHSNPRLEVRNINDVKLVIENIGDYSLKKSGDIVRETLNNKNSILAKLGQNRQLMQQRFSVRSIGLFGSCIRDEATPDSDIDLLVEFDNPTFDNYMDLKSFLEDIFQAKVDLVLADTVKPRLQPYIAREIVYA